MKLTPPDLLTPPEKSLRNYLQANHHRPEFAVARRQKWPTLLELLTRALDKLQEAHLAFVRQKHVAAALYMAGTGAIDEKMINGAELLSTEEKRQCKHLRSLHLIATTSPWLPIVAGLPEPLPRTVTGAEELAEDHTEDFLVWEQGAAYIARLYGSGLKRTWWQAGVNRVLYPSHYQPLNGPIYEQIPAPVAASEPAGN